MAKKPDTNDTKPTTSIIGIEVMSNTKTREVFILIESDVNVHGLDMNHQQAKDLHATLGKVLKDFAWEAC